MTYILAADDEIINQMILEEMIEGYGEVDCVDDGLQCLASIDKRIPDVLLLDVSMPNMDGFEVCRKLRTNSKFKELPIILLSGHAHSEQIEEGLRAGANKYITKPFSKKELIDGINEILGIN